MMKKNLILDGKDMRTEQELRQKLSELQVDLKKKEHKFNLFQSTKYKLWIEFLKNGIAQLNWILNNPSPEVSKIDTILEELRKLRDTHNDNIRLHYNSVCDSLEVLKSKLTGGVRSGTLFCSMAGKGVCPYEYVNGMCGCTTVCVNQVEKDSIRCK